MAQKVHVLLVCDLHDDEAEGSETIAFSLDGSAYEIDVCDAHGAELRDAFAPFVGAARRAGRITGAARSRRASRSPAVRRRDVSAVREWARKNGHRSTSAAASRPSSSRRTTPRTNPDRRARAPRDHRPAPVTGGGPRRASPAAPRALAHGRDRSRRSRAGERARCPRGWK